jgi:glycosyltransferase 2 family protein
MPPDTGSKRWIQLIVGVAISALMIWLAFRGQDLGVVWQHVQAMRWPPMLLAIVVATLPFVLRVPRWRLLLHREDGSTIGPAPMWHAIAIGFAANNTLPFRLGEVLRVGAISRLAPVPFSSALSSLLVERVLDALTVVALFSGALMLVDIPVDGGAQRAMARIGILGAIGLLLAIIAALFPSQAERVVVALTPSGRVRELAVKLTRRLLDGVGALRDPRRAVPVVAWSLVIWLVNASAFWVAFRAFGIDAPFAAALVLQGVLVIGIALPQAPGFVGGFEAAIVASLLLFGVSQEVALAYAVTYHVTTFVPITLMGAWSLVTSGVSLRSAREAAT